MRKFLRKLKDGGSGKERANLPDPNLSRQSSKHVVDPSGRHSYYPPNPAPPNPPYAPNPVPPNPYPPYQPPPPGPSNLDAGPPITGFSGFESFMSSFAPDPQQHGVVEIAAGPVDEIECLEIKGFPAHESISVTIQKVKKDNRQWKRYTVVISGPWHMTLAQVNQVLKENVVDGPSSYDPDWGLLINRHESFGAFVTNLRRLYLSCSGGMLKAESFPASIEIDFNRTLRLPEGIDIHHHPSGLGIIPVYNTAAIQKKLMESRNQSLVDMAKKGGIFFPLYQREAMFITFNAVNDIFALRLFVGGVNALSGVLWNSQRPQNKQDYILVPPQVRIDGVSVGDDVVKQFIAMPLGSGYSVEKQVTGKETTGGLQIEITPGDLWQMFSMGDEGSQLHPESTPAHANADVFDLRFAAPGWKSAGLPVDLPDNREEAKYLHMRHLYLQQLGDTSNGYALFGQQPDHLPGFVPWRPGANVNMVALYQLELDISWLDSGCIRLEKVQWSPWWDLMDCWEERKNAGFEIQGQELSACDIFIGSIDDGRLLVDGRRHSIQQQGVQDGDMLCVQPRKSDIYSRYRPQSTQAASPMPPQMQQMQTQQMQTQQSPNQGRIQELYTPSPQSPQYQQPQDQQPQYQQPQYQQPQYQQPQYQQAPTTATAYARPPPSPPRYYEQSSTSPSVADAMPPPPPLAPRYYGQDSTSAAAPGVPMRLSASPTSQYGEPDSAPPVQPSAYPGRSSDASTPEPLTVWQQSAPQFSYGSAPTQDYGDSRYSSTPIPEPQTSRPPALQSPQSSAPQPYAPQSESYAPRPYDPLAYASSSYRYSPSPGSAGQTSPGPGTVAPGRSDYSPSPYQSVADSPSPYQSVADSAMPSYQSVADSAMPSYQSIDSPQSPSDQYSLSHGVSTAPSSPPPTSPYPMVPGKQQPVYGQQPGSVARPPSYIPPPRQDEPKEDVGWAMGIAAGARIRQHIFADRFPTIRWSKSRSTLLSIQILNSVAFEALTGMLTPPTPITPDIYKSHGFPFFAAWGEGAKTDGADNLFNLKSVGDIDASSPIRFGSNVTQGLKIACTSCGKNLCDSMARATKLVGFSAPMALPGQDIVDLSQSTVLTVAPFRGSSGFQPVQDDKSRTGINQDYRTHNFYELG
ncbi:hypothetical protein EDB80DRAFT_690042 [Ilyonectria destructans]|nr:hypothetical protein EDB80DRAFT_690042 [Ilyonectria destructans]